ncbi:MAG: acyl carrier protein [Solirubrobacterales bacterium]
MPQTKSKEEIEQRVTDALVEFGEERENVSLGARLEELEVDSLDLVELAQITEDEYGVEITDADMDGLVTVGDVVELIASRA